MERAKVGAAEGLLSAQALATRPGDLGAEAFVRLPVFAEMEDALLGIILQPGWSPPRAVAYDRTKVLSLLMHQGWTPWNCPNGSATRLRRGILSVWKVLIWGLDLRGF